MTDDKGKRAATGSPKRSPTRRPAAAKQTKATPPRAKAIGDVSGTVTEPIAKVVAPVTRRAAATQRKVKKVVRQGTGSVRNAAKAAPGSVAKLATTAIDGATSAVTSRTAGLVGAAAAGLVTGLALNLGRKIVVQAPSALAGDWFDAVKAEHKLALALFDQLEATSDTDGRKRSMLLTQLKHALGKHAFMEENVLYPALRAWGDKADADKLNHDHGYVKQYLYELEEMDNAAPAFLETVADFRAQIEAHIREEEDAIFPPLHAALGKEGNAKVTAQANKEAFKLA